MSDIPPRTDLTSVKTLTFDGDDTLWDFRSAIEAALALTLEELRRIVQSDAARKLTTPEMIQIRDCVAKEMGATVNLDEVRFAAFVRTLEHIGAPSGEVAGRLFSFYKEARLSGTRPYPDVPTALKRLEERYHIGLISNGNSGPVLSRLPIAFDFTVFAQDCGFAKPDRRIFEFALAAGGCDPAEVLHVGDSLEDDVLGANNAGISRAWLNRRGTENEAPIAPDFEIRDLSELAALLLE